MAEIDILALLKVADSKNKYNTPLIEKLDSIDQKNEQKKSPVLHHIDNIQVKPKSTLFQNIGRIERKEKENLAFPVLPTNNVHNVKENISSSVSHTPKLARKGDIPSGDENTDPAGKSHAPRRARKGDIHSGDGNTETDGKSHAPKRARKGDIHSGDGNTETAGKSHAPKRARKGDIHSGDGNTDPAGKSHAPKLARKDWTFHVQFTLEQLDWNALQSASGLLPTYVDFFIDYMNLELGINCVLKSNGPYIAYDLYVLRFACTNGRCKRQYQVKQIESCNFKVYNNGVNEDHDGSERCRPIKGPKRQIVAKGLSQMVPEDYLVLCQRGISKKLLDNGNLQDYVSLGTAQKLRSLTLVENLDYDKDDIIDVLKMKLEADLEYLKPNSVTDIFIRRFNLDPFAILMYSNSQLQLLKALSMEDEDEELTLNFDASGDLARHSIKRIFYYVGVIRVKINALDEKEKARLQPILEFLSGAHDAHNIRLLLEDFRKDWEEKYPNRMWPIKYVITDFSFALLNAICRAWNGVKLIIYINLTYQFAGDPDYKAKLRSVGIVTLLELCCGHFSKTFSNDVSKYFPNMDADKQAVLKEIFFAMFDISDLNILRAIWINLSTILLSKYVNSTVESALKTLANIILADKAKANRHDQTFNESEEQEKEENPIPDDTDRMEAMYKQSAYYKDFLPLTYKPQYQNETVLNEYYCVEFSNVFLKKYIPILCLWTCITQKGRKHNAPSESHFKNSKSRFKRRQTEIGTLPLKAGRVCRELEKYTMATTFANTLKLPRKNNCYKQKPKEKRKIDGSGNDQCEAKRLKILGENHGILELYRSAPKPPPKPKTPSASIRKSTPTSNRRLTPNSSYATTPATTPTGRKIKMTPQTLVFNLQPNEEIDYPINDCSLTPKLSHPTTSAKTQNTLEPIEEIADQMVILEENDLPIDDQSVQEEWYSNRRVRHSHMDKKMLKGIKSSDDSKLKSILEKKPKCSKVVFVSKTKNGLIDDPYLYIKPAENFVVSRIGEAILNKIDYELLFRDVELSKELIRYICGLFEVNEKTVQFDFVALSKIVQKETPPRLFKIKKPIFIGIDIEHLTIFILNFTKKTFACVDPTQSPHPKLEIFFQNFLDFIMKYECKSSKNVPKEGWQLIQFEHQLHQSTNDRGLYILNYVQQYLSDSKMDAEVKCDTYKKELQHVILYKSASMKSRCIKCGRGNLPQKDNETSTSWIGCNNCCRWAHLECVNLNASLEQVQEETVNFFCLICKSNTPQAHSTEQDNHLDKLVQQ